MKEKRATNQRSISDLMHQIYKEVENKKQLDYWNGYSQIIIDSQNLRYENKYSQTDLAKAMGTTQSVVSRFENMGRKPSYDFFARLALAFNHSPGMTLYGDYMSVVPTKYQKMIEVKASEQGISTSDFVQNLLEQALKDLVCSDNKAHVLKCNT